MVRAVILLGCLAILLPACDSTGPATSIGRTPDSISTDTVPPPVPPDTVPSDSTPGPDSLPPPDSVGPPPDSTGGPDLPPYTPTHRGIPFGPAQTPPEAYSPEFNGTVFSAAGSTPEGLIAVLEKARRLDARIFINLTGNPEAIRDEQGFSLSKWTSRVNRFRNLDLTSYIKDGTLLGHYVNDEPQDPTNWNGKRIPPPVLEEMAKYSKEIWPNLPTMVAVWPSYLKGHQYTYLDAVRVHYHIRFGPIEPYIAEHTREAKALGLALISGLNLLNGGTGESGIPGRKEGKFAMSAREIRNWGDLVMADPYICAFLMWEYDTKYLARTDIKEALAELKGKAEKHPGPTCRKP